MEMPASLRSDDVHLRVGMVFGFLPERCSVWPNPQAGENSTIWASPSPKFIMGGSDESKYDHPTQTPVDLMRRPILNHLKRGELVYEPFVGSGTTLAAAEIVPVSQHGPHATNEPPAGRNHPAPFACNRIK
jgi:hypothetical protein